METSKQEQLGDKVPRPFGVCERDVVVRREISAV